MNIAESFAIITLAALIHASFQLSVSVLTLLSGHAISAKHSKLRLFSLTTSYISGAGIMTILLLTACIFFVINTYGMNIPSYIWITSCGLMFGVAIFVWLFYYRRKKGTTLWIPRGVADYLISRTKATKSNGEAFGLGLSSVFGELLFIIAPIFITSLIIVRLSPVWQLAGVGIYLIVSMLSLLIVWALICKGYNLSKIQKWREYNKYFLQFAAGAGLLVLGFYVYVNVIIGSLGGVI